MNKPPAKPSPAKPALRQQPARGPNPAFAKPSVSRGPSSRLNLQTSGGDVREQNSSINFNEIIMSIKNSGCKNYFLSFSKCFFYHIIKPNLYTSIKLDLSALSGFQNSQRPPQTSNQNRPRTVVKNLETSGGDIRQQFSGILTSFL